MKMAHVTKEREYSGFTHEEAAIVVLLTDNKLHKSKEVKMNFRYERQIEALKVLTTKVQ